APAVRQAQPSGRRSPAPARQCHDPHEDGQSPDRPRHQGPLLAIVLSLVGGGLRFVPAAEHVEELIGRIDAERPDDERPEGLAVIELDPGPDSAEADDQQARPERLVDGMVRIDHGYSPAAWSGERSVTISRSRMENTSPRCPS